MEQILIKMGCEPDKAVMIVKAIIDFLTKGTAFSLGEDSKNKLSEKELKKRQMEELKKKREEERK